ncbi:hypothetical protein GCM10018952_18920 [Streptosporangium vulgare]
MAAGRHRPAQGGDDALGVVRVGDEMHDRQQEDPDGPVEVDRRAHVRVLQDLPGPADVPLDDGHVLVLAEDRPAVDQDGRVVVDVDDPGVGGDLVHVVLGGQPGADVEELVDPRLGEETDRPAQERAIGAGTVPDLGDDLQCLLRGLPIHREVVLASQVVVVHARDVGNMRLDTLGYLVGHVPLPGNDISRIA